MKNRKIEILYLVPSFILGGSEMQLLYLVRGLDRKLFNVHVGAFYQMGALRSQFEQSNDASIIYFNKKGSFDFSYLRRLVRYLQEKNFDIIQMYNTSAKAIGMLTALLCHIPVKIITERSAADLPTSPGSRIYLHLEKRLIRYATILVANSIAGAEFLKTKGAMPEKIQVIYNGLDLERLKVTRSNESIRQELGIGRDDPVVGIVGSLKFEKDHDTFLAAARWLLEKMPDCKFLIIGDGPRRYGLRQLADALGVSKSVFFTGQKPDVANYLNILSVATLTSPKTEGCSNAILEAMALAKPVVVTNVGGNAELVQDTVTGFLVAPRDFKNLTEKILTVIRDSCLANRMGELACQKIQNEFNLKRMIDQYQQLYFQVLDSHTNV